MDAVRAKNKVGVSGAKFAALGLSVAKMLTPRFPLRTGLVAFAVLLGDAFRPTGLEPADRPAFAFEALRLTMRVNPDLNFTFIQYSNTARIF